MQHILVEGTAGDGFEAVHQPAAAEIKAPAQAVYTQVSGEILIDIGQDFVDFGVASWGALPQLRFGPEHPAVDPHHELGEQGLGENLGAEIPAGFALQLPQQAGQLFLVIAPPVQQIGVLPPAAVKTGLQPLVLQGFGLDPEDCPGIGRAAADDRLMDGVGGG